MLLSKKEHFVVQYYHFAKKAEKATGIPALFALAQCALETEWGKTIKGNMLFGIKKGLGKNYGGWNGMTQWIITTEYADTPYRIYPTILAGYPLKLANGKWQYKIKDEFRAYSNAYYAMVDWAGLLLQSKRYQSALQYKDNPFQFATAISKAGYATDPNYSQKIHSIIRSITTIVHEQKLTKTTSKAAFPAVIVGFGAILFIAALINHIIEES